LTVLLVALLGLALLGGCGDSKKKSTSTSSSPSTAPAQSSTPASTPGGPVSKAEYESRLVTALRPAQSAGTLASRITKTSSTDSDARVFDQVAGIYQRAYDQIKDIKPPTEVADLHGQVVAALGSLAKDANKARDALRNKDKGAYQTALGDFKAQGQKLQSLGSQLTARGY